MQQRCFNVNRPPISLSPFSRPNSENYATSRVGGEEGSGLINEPVIAWFKDRSLVVRGGCDLNIIANYTREYWRQRSSRLEEEASPFKVISSREIFL